MAAFSTTYALFLMFSLVFGAPFTCPNTEDLFPCTCKRVAYGLHVVCANFNDSNSLIRAFRILRDYHVHNVLLHGLNLKDVLPSDLFDGLHIKELRVEKCSLKFSQPAFKGLDDYLYVLNVAQHTMIKSDEDFVIARLRKLTELNIKANPLGKVKDTWFNGKVPNVHTIVLDEDEITEIDNHAFAQLPQLQMISMADNRIKTVKRSMFPKPAESLKRIDLSLNEIKSLPEDIFHSMPSLREVVLSGNDLETLPQQTWEPVWQQLTQVLLFENKLKCDQALEWIKVYRKPYQLEGNCVSPNHMNGKSIKDVYNT